MSRIPYYSGPTAEHFNGERIFPPCVRWADKTRLDDHLQRVSELQRRLATMVTCTYPTAPGAPHAQAQLGHVIYNPIIPPNEALQLSTFNVVNDLIGAPFSFRSTRIATKIIDLTFVDSVP